MILETKLLVAAPSETQKYLAFHYQPLEAEIAMFQCLTYPAGEGYWIRELQKFLGISARPNRGQTFLPFSQFQSRFLLAPN
jgi:hypothetical protein